MCLFVFGASCCEGGMPPAASERKNRPKHMGPYQKVTERTAAAATARANATREHKNRAYQMLGVHV